MLQVLNYKDNSPLQQIGLNQTGLNQSVLEKAILRGAKYSADQVGHGTGEDREAIFTKWLETQARARQKELDAHRGSLNLDPETSREDLQLICHFHKMEFFGKTLLLESGVVDFHHPPKGSCNVDIPCLFLEYKTTRTIRDGYYMIDHRFMLNPYHPGRLKASIPQIDCLEFVDNNGVKIRPEIWSVLPFDPVLNQMVYEHRMTDSSWCGDKSLYQLLEEGHTDTTRYRSFEIIRDNHIPIEYAIPPYWKDAWKKFITGKLPAPPPIPNHAHRNADGVDDSVHLEREFSNEFDEGSDTETVTRLFATCGLTGSRTKAVEVVSKKSGNSIKHYSHRSGSEEDSLVDFEAHCDRTGKLEVLVDRRPKSSSGLSFGYKAGYLIDPETGQQSSEACVIKLEIDNREGRVAFYGSETKIRAEKVRVVAMAKLHQNAGSRNLIYEFCHPSNANGISDMDTAFGYVFGSFQYRLGDQIQIHNYNPNLNQVCVPGIHFFWTQMGVLDFIGGIRTPLENEIMNFDEMAAIDLAGGVYTLEISPISKPSLSKRRNRRRRRRHRNRRKTVKNQIRESIELSDESCSDSSSSSFLWGNLFDSDSSISSVDFDENDGHIDANYESGEGSGAGSGSSSSECPICLISLSEAEVSLTNCQHRFHESCLADVYHYDSEKKCPLCRAMAD